MGQCGAPRYADAFPPDVDAPMDEQGVRLLRGEFKDEWGDLADANLNMPDFVELDEDQ